MGTTARGYAGECAGSLQTRDLEAIYDCHRASHSGSDALQLEEKFFQGQSIKSDTSINSKTNRITSVAT
jgi:hypothetical protein